MVKGVEMGTVSTSVYMASSCFAKIAITRSFLSTAMMC